MERRRRSVRAPVLVLLSKCLLGIMDEMMSTFAGRWRVYASETFDKDALIQDHRMCCEKLQKQRIDQRFSGVQLSCGDEFQAPAASARFSALRRIAISELKLHQRHRGRVLYGTLCERPLQMTAIRTLLEDETGRVIRVSIYNAVTASAGMPDIDAMFPKGMGVAIKEPHFERYADGCVGLRVDNPADIVVVTSTIPDREGVGQDSEAAAMESLEGKTIKEKADVLRKEGNRHFCARNWDKAAEFYTKCIDVIESVPACLPQVILPPPIAPIGKRSKPSKKKRGQNAKGSVSSKNSSPCQSGSALVEPVSVGSRTTDLDEQLNMAYSNRAEAWLKTGRHAKALGDAVRALELDPEHAKSLLRKGRALVGLHCYQEAIPCLKDVLKGGGTVMSTQGRREIEDMLQDAVVADKQGRLGVFDLNDFYLNNCQGPPPKCTDFVGPVEIRKVAGTDDINIGRGMFVTRDVEEGELLLMSNPLAVAKGYPGGLLGLVFNRGLAGTAVREGLIEEVIQSCMACPRKLQQVYALADSVHGLNDLPIPSMKLFKPPSSSVEACATPSAHDAGAQIDVSRIRRIVDRNSILVQSAHVAEGLWGLPSLINHSCIPNSSGRHVGTAMLVRALRNLSAGEEVTVAYVKLHQPLEERNKYFSVRDGGRCCCPRCSFERRVMEQFPSEFNSLAGKHAQIEASADEISKISQGIAVVKELEAILGSLHDAHETSKNWIRSSYLEAYVVNCTHLQVAAHQGLSLGLAATLWTTWAEAVDSMLDIVSCCHSEETFLSLIAVALQYFPVPPQFCTRWTLFARRACKLVHGPLPETTMKGILKNQAALLGAL